MDTACIFRRLLVIAVYGVASWICTQADAQSLSLRGQVADESGAVVPGATVALRGPGGARSAKAGGDGTYSFTGLAAGNYTVTATAPQLGLRQPVKVALRESAQTLNLTLSVFAEKQQVTVEDNSKPAVSTDAAANATALVLRGADLDALSDNPDDLAADLQALAGPAAGPNGGTVFIDGFSGGQLPPKNSIREIRINQNPFSPEYDKLGYGRVEIFTKPGSEKFHADLGYNFATDKWNSRNPYAGPKAPFHLHELREMISGPLGKKASFNLTGTREWVDNGNAVNTVILNSQTLGITPFTDTPLAQLRRTVVSPRVDFQLGTNNTMSVRYSYNRDIVRNAGTGGFNLASRGYHNDARSQTVQVTETAVVSASVINETRFQYFRPTTVSVANTAGAAVQVLGSFNGGGNPIGFTTDRQNTYEFQNYTSAVRGTHTFRFGVRARGATAVNISPQNFGGTFVFGGGPGPVLDSQGLPVLDAKGQPVIANISSIESYRRTLLFQGMGLDAARIRQLGGGASQFSINAGDPRVTGDQVDVGAFFGDDWRARPNLTLNFGLRYETQTNIHDWRDVAPRVGVAWAPGAVGKSKAKTVVRAGFGMFYDRFALGNVLAAQRFNGTLQQQYFVTNPDFYPSFGPQNLLQAGASASTIQAISSTLRAPYLMQSAVSVERQLPRNTTVAVTYANTHGLHIFRTNNINTPLPGTYNPDIATSGVYPYGRRGPVLLMESSGLYNQNQVIFNVNTKVSNSVSLNGLYAIGRAMSNSDGLSTYPANPYSMAGEYGPSSIDQRHRVSLSGTITTKWGVRWNPLITANTGPPFDITAGQDLFGTTLFNARPGIATDASKAGVVRTEYGLLDPNPVPGQALLPRNYGRGPGQVMVNLRIGRTFTFGSSERKAPVSNNPGGVSTPGGGGANRGDQGGPFTIGGSGGGATVASRRYSLVISMMIRNLLNHNNPGPIIGNITSPLFGLANQPAGSGNGIFAENANNRRLEMQMRLTF